MHGEAERDVAVQAPYRAVPCRASSCSTPRLLGRGRARHEDGEQPPVVLGTAGGACTSLLGARRQGQACLSAPGLGFGAGAQPWQGEPRAGKGPRDPCIPLPNPGSSGMRRGGQLGCWFFFFSLKHFNIRFTL